MKRLLAIGLTAAMLVGSLVGCGSSSSSSTSGSSSSAAASEEKSTIKFGVLAPLTGTNAEYGTGFQVATQMAVDKINAAGGVNGHMLELEVKDSKGDTKESSDLARMLADDEEIMAIIGDFTSSACMANAPIVDEAGIVQLSPTASNPDYAGLSDYCFSIMGRQDGEAPFFAKYVIGRYMGLSKVGVIYINSDWGVSCYDNFAAQCEKEGIEIVEAVNYVQDEKDFSSLITKLKAADPEVIIIMDQGAVPQIINQIRGSGWTDVPLTTLGPGTSEQMLDLVGENGEGLLLTSPFFFDPDDEELMEWKAEFAEKAGFEPTVHPVCAYDCVYLLAAAIEACGDDITRQNIRDNLAAVEITGVTGPIKFNENGDITRQYLICGVENGEYVIEEGFDYSAEGL